MTTITPQLFDELTRYDGPTCASIMLPIDLAHPDAVRDHNVLKGLVSLARAELQRYDAVEVDRLLAPIDAVMRSRTVASHRGSAAWFLAPGYQAALQIPYPVEALAVVGDRFHMTQLIPTVDQAWHGYVVTLGSSEVMLYRIDAGGWVRCIVPNLPTDMNDPRLDEPLVRHSGAHSGGPLGTSIATIHHGSTASDERDRRRERFFRLVDQTIRAFIGTEARLLVAGSSPNVALYRDVSGHTNVRGAAVGSPPGLTDVELRARVGDVIEATRAEADTRRVADFRERDGTGRVSGDLAELVEAARAGRLDSVVVRSGAPRWGTGNAPMVELSERSAGAIDLVNLIVSDTWRHGGTVHRWASGVASDLPDPVGFLRY